MTRKPFLLFLVLFIPVFAGCINNDNNNTGVEVRMTTDTTLEGTVVTTSSNVTGDGDTDFPDRFLTPLSFTAAIKSAKLIKEGDTSVSYTIFDRGL